MTPNLEKLFQGATPGPYLIEPGEEADAYMLCVDLSRVAPNSVSVLFESDWGTEADARLLTLLATHGRALIEALEEAYSYLRIRNLGEPARQLEGSLQQLLATLERDAKGPR